MGVCTCPYCMDERELTRQNVKYYIRIEKDPISRKLQDFLKPEQTAGNPFHRFWNAYGVTIPPKVLDHRIVKSEEELDREQAIFAAEEEQYGRQAMQKTAPSETEAGLLLPGQGAAKNLDDTGAGSRVVCEIQKEQKGLEPPKYMIRENGQRVAITKTVCPWCHNVLPDGIFDLPVIKIALAAGKGGGKTCLALSLFRTLRSSDGRGLNSHVGQMDFVSMLEANTGIDDEFNEMLKDFCERGICPRPTNEHFIPPIFLKMNWHGRQERKAIVGLYDAAGETLTGSIRDSELVYYMAHMDGIIYMIEPNRTGIRAGLTNRYLFIRNDSDQFYKQARLLSPDEQMAVQTEDYRRVTLAEIMEQQGDGGMAAVRDNSSMAVLTALRGYVDDTALKDMHVALAISKCDELRENREIEEYNQGNLLFMDERKMDVNQNSMREDLLRKLFEAKVFNLQLFENVFSSYSLHMIAALGCPTEVPKDGEKDDGDSEAHVGSSLVKPVLKGNFSPIRVEEPLLKLIALYAEEHGWNE